MSEDEDGMKMQMGWEGPMSSTWHKPPVLHIDK